MKISPPRFTKLIFRSRIFTGIMPNKSFNSVAAERFSASVQLCRPRQNFILGSFGFHVNCPKLYMFRLISAVQVASTIWFFIKQVSRWLNAHL